MHRRPEGRWGEAGARPARALPVGPERPDEFSEPHHEHDEDREQDDDRPGSSHRTPRWLVEGAIVTLGFEACSAPL
jgi:hypothetical protein